LHAAVNLAAKLSDGKPARAHPDHPRELEDAQDGANCGQRHLVMIPPRNAGTRFLHERFEADWFPMRSEDVKNAGGDLRTGEKIDERVFQSTQVVQETVRWRIGRVHSAADEATREQKRCGDQCDGKE